MQTLNFLGNGSAFNTEFGNTSAYIKEDKTLLLIDCGETTFQKIKEINLLKGIKNVKVLITHLHSDHSGSLSSLIYYCYYIMGIKVKIYNNSLQNDIEAFLSFQGNRKGVHYEFLSNLEGIEEIETSHSEDLKSYGYYIRYKNKSIYFSGDSKSIPEKILKMFLDNEIDEIYQDTCLAEYDGNVHLDFSKLCRYIPKVLRRKVYCMHLDSKELKTKVLNNGFKIAERI